MAVEMPDAEVTASNDHDQSIAYAKENEPESNILLRRWQQSRSFASAWIDGFKFLTDDRNDNEKGNSVFHEVGNPFSVGQEYSGYYMDHVNCGTGERFSYPESYSYRDYDHRNSYHIFRDTRLDSTGPDGRIKDRTLLGDMERGKESDTSSFVDVEDYSGNNIKEQSDLEKEGSGCKRKQTAWHAGGWKDRRRRICGKHNEDLREESEHHAGQEGCSGHGIFRYR